VSADNPESVAYRRDVAVNVLAAIDVDQYLIDAVRDARPPVAPSLAVEADEATHVPCPDCGDDPKEPQQHADGCRRIGQSAEIQCGPPWQPFPEPTPEQVEAARCTCAYPDDMDPAAHIGCPAHEQVEAASAPEWARGDAANAESDAIEALVHAFAPSASDNYRRRLRVLAGRVLEVGGQQPGVPVEKVREVVAALRRWASQEGRLVTSAYAYKRAADYVADALLPTAPPS
jgi:hypothetical protein